MKIERLGFVLVLGMALLLAGCGSSSTSKVAAIRSYNGTAAVGDFLNISVDSAAKTITYNNHTNGETGTVPYTVNADGGYTITDPAGNLLSAYEVPGSAMVVQVANAGPNRDTASLITAVESVPTSIQNFVGKNFNYAQFRHVDGGMEFGNVTIDAQGNITSNSWGPGAIMWQGSDYFHGGTFPASSVVEDSSGNFFVVHESDSSSSTVFGTQNGLWAVDNSNGSMLSFAKAATKNFDSTKAGTYSAIYFKKANAQSMNEVETGTASTGKATVAVTSAGAVTITDSSNNAIASGTLVPVADASYLYDGTANKLPDPCYGLFVFQTVTSSLHQDVFVTFQGNALVFESFQTALPVQNGSTYTYYQGAGVKQ